MKSLLLTSMVALLTVTAMPVAHAQTKTFRCKNDLVNLGDSRASALLKCGEPLVRDSFCSGKAAVVVDPHAAFVSPPFPHHRRAPVIVQGGACDTVDEWTYNPGYGQFMTTLRFESGRLAEISYGDRVR